MRIVTYAYLAYRTGKPDAVEYHASRIVFWYKVARDDAGSGDVRYVVDDGLNYRYCPINLPSTTYVVSSFLLER